MLVRSKPVVLIGSVFALLVGMSVASAMYLPGGIELCVLPVQGDEPILVLPLEPNERFTIHYYHSVENAPIWEVHSVDADGRIFVEEERYLKFGAGMGKMPGVGTMVKRGPYEVIENMHFPTGNFTLRIGSPGVDHTILWRGTRTNLSELAPHEAVQFSAEPVSWFHCLWRKLQPHRATPIIN
jgi:hypothetical protein